MRTPLSPNDNAVRSGLTLPRKTNWRMPAEWEPHEATWLTWPANPTTWPGRLLKEVESIYVRMIAALLPDERVKLLVQDDRTKKKVLKLLPRTAKLNNLIFYKVPYVDSWIRDYGPVFVEVEGRRWKMGGKTFTKWRFNGWGGKYDDLATDDGVVDRLDELKDYKRIDTGIILEGGSIESNGRGSCLTTEQCLLNSNRNPQFSKKELEKILEKFLGFTNVIWLKKGIEGDDTDGHIDDLARFVGPRTVIAACESDLADQNHRILKENFSLLKKAADENGRRFTVVELPMPGRMGVSGIGTHKFVCPPPYSGDTQICVSPRLPASYANFYVGNAAVLVPTYGHANDQKALGVIRRFFPRRKVIGIECTALVYGLGALHCVTQQEPK